MAITRIPGTQDQYVSDKPLVLTGPITGSVILPDGTVYNVTDAVIEVEEGHQLLVSDAIGARYAAEGHPNMPGETFVHVPSSVTHNPDGTPNEAFAASVHANAPQEG